MLFVEKMKPDLIFLFIYIESIMIQVRTIPLTSPSALETYIRYCGADKLCGEFTNDIPNNTLTKTSCPKCDCDVDCYMKGTCCPDFHLNTCASISLYFASESKRSSDSVYLISKCPLNTIEEVKKLCESSSTQEDILTAVPVKSILTNISYKNKHCAECNGEQILQPWGLSVEECMKENFDINVYSNLESIYKGIEEFRCNFGYDWTLAGTTVTKCQKRYISSCNVTGLWDKYDPTIECACENFHSPITFFDNIFCYNCNSGTTSSNAPIDRCPVGTDRYISELCFHEMKDPNWFPYKNSYCYRCGAVDSLDFAHHYYSFNASSIYPYELTVSLQNITEVLCNLKKTHLYRYLRISKTVLPLCHTDENIIQDEDVYFEQLFNEIFKEFLNKQNSSQNNIDFVSLYKIFEKFGGKSGWCFNGNNYECSCEPDCFDTNHCCPDMMSEARYKCVKYGQQWLSLVVKCPFSFNDDVIRYYCERQDGDLGSIVDHIPIISYPYQYRNIFCFLCNLDPYGNINEFFSSYIRNITFKCPNYVNIDDSLMLSQTYEFLKASCQVEIPLINVRETLFHCEPFFNTTLSEWTCPKTEKPFQHKNDIAYLCENERSHIYRYNCKPYRNIFCEICDHIEHCSDKGCPHRMVHGRMNFKGCFKYVVPSYNVPFPCDICINYRHIFSVFEREYKEESVISQENCKETETLDPKTGLCRFISCSPGKMYKGGCISLLSLTKDLQYSLTLEMNFNNTVRNHLRTTVDFNYLLHELSEMIAKEFKKGSHMHVTNIACKKIEEKFENTLLAMSFNIFIKTKGFVSRDDAEDQLFIIQSRLQNLYNVEFFSSMPLKDYPVGQVAYESICQSLVLNNSTLTGNIFSVDKFLKCPQFILEVNEYAIEDNELSLTSDLATLKPIDFMKYNSKIRVCISDYMILFTGKNISHFTFWDIVPTFCVCTSILCLLLTMIIYIVLKQFKSLPGKNILCLIVSQLCAQTILLLRNMRMQGTLCMVIGGLTHYIWLTMFFATTNCSFHIHRALNIDFPLQNTEQSPFFKSLFFMLIGPTLLVGSYVFYIYIIDQSLPYDTMLCFIADFYALLSFFLVPVSVICSINLVFFIRISYNLYSMTVVRCNDEKRNNCIICIKLFLVTGLSWILQLVDAFCPSSLFTYIVSVINGCQGTLVFLILTFSKNVRRAFRLSLSKTNSSNLDASFRNSDRNVFSP